MVPEYGDMSMTMLVILKRAPHWDSSMEKSWGSEPDRKVVSRYSLLTHWSEIKSHHAEYLSKFSKTTIELAAYDFKKALTATRLMLDLSNASSWQKEEWILEAKDTVDTVSTQVVAEHSMTNLIISRLEQ